MRADTARARLRDATGLGVRVAIVDSGWAAAVDDTRVRCGSQGIAGADLLGHGTACAARVLQVAPKAEIVVVKVFRDRLETSVAELCEGIEQALAAGVDIVNLSLATRLDEAIRPLYALCEKARLRGTVVVAAGHNRGGPAFPAWLEPVLAIEAGRQTDLLDYTYRPCGPIECSAAALGVPVALPGGGLVQRSGSSIAAATMSGVVARLVETGVVGLDAVRARLALTASPPPMIRRSFNSV